jgi:hypothetical protein
MRPPLDVDRLSFIISTRFAGKARDAAQFGAD